MQSFVLREGAWVAAFVWSVSNGIIIYAIALSLASLEINNKRFVALFLQFVVCLDKLDYDRLRLDLAAIRSSVQYKDPIKHVLVMAKVESLPFGVTFYRTRKFITFDGIFTLTSFLVSAFLFLIGFKSASA